MVSSTYPEAINRLLKHEGGYSNHPSDPGGPTNFGITIGDYRRYIKSAATADDVKRMKVEQAKEIYRTKYWKPQKGDELAPGVDYSVFDYGVNSGTGRSGKVLRRVCGLPSNTSVITPEVIAAANKRDAVMLTVAINEERLRFLRGLKTWPVFGTGWNRRVAEVRAYSIGLASGKKVLQPQQPLPTPGKGEIPKPPVGKIGGGAAGGTALAGGGLWETIWNHPITTAALIAVMIAAVASLIVFLVKRRNRLQEEPLPVMVVPENVVKQDNKP